MERANQSTIKREARMKDLGASMTAEREGLHELRTIYASAWHWWLSVLLGAGSWQNHNRESER
jgi:hypothetical protein